MCERNADAGSQRPHAHEMSLPAGYPADSVSPAMAKEEEEALLGCTACTPLK